MKINDRINYDEVKSNITMNNLKKLIDSRDISPLKLSQNGKITVSESTILAYINGQKSPSLPVLISIADYLNCNLDYLLDRTNNPSKIDDVQNDEELVILIELIKTLPYEKKKLLEAYVKGLLGN